MKHRTTVKMISVILALCMTFPMLSLSAFAATSTSERIVVSMGDSYSSGEGVEPFYGTESMGSRSGEFYESEDFLAHRSKYSWPGKLKLNNQSLSEQKDKNWFFVASSGAETKHFKGKANKSHTRMIGQKKTYKRDGVDKSKYLDAQLTIFKDLKEQGLSADYVTLTIGGNDVGFTDIIAMACVEGNIPYLCPTLLADKLNKAWHRFYHEGIKENIRQAYNDVRNAAGKETNIIVAGYPRLVADLPVQNKSFTAYEAKIINHSVSKFNNELENIINGLSDDKIHFVSVEEEFKGHEAYAFKDSYINAIMPTQKYDLSEFDINNPLKTVASNFSAYSMHPNKDGTEAYARCVQKKINEIENKNGRDNQIEDAGNWRQAYMDYLKKYMNEVDSPNDCGFSLVYIDNDDTPELIIREGDAHVSSASVYTCIDSNVIELVADLSGTYGIVGYVERKGLIYSDVTYNGNSETTIYSVDKNICKKVISLFSNEGATPEGMAPEYRINDRIVSESKYNNAWDKYKDNNLSYSSDNDMALSLGAIESINSY